MKKMILVCVALILTACNTIQGAGEDIQGAGTWTANTAAKTKQKIEGQ